MEEQKLIDWILSKNTREILITLSLAGGIIFLLYGIFKGRPPFLKAARIDDIGRHYCVRLGSVLLFICFMTLLLPTFYQLFLEDKYRIYIDSKPLPDDYKIIAMGPKGDRINGKITVQKKEQPTEAGILTLATYPKEVQVFTGPLSLYGKRGDKLIQLINGDGEMLYVSDNDGKIWGPLQIRDSNNNDIFKIPVYNYGEIIVPHNARVSLYSATILYREKDLTIQRENIGSKLDFRTWSYGEHQDLFKEWEEPRSLTVHMISDKFEGNVMASGIKYDPNQIMASSGSFPIGTVIFVGNPFIKYEPIEVIVKDSSQSNLVLSKVTYEKLQFEYNSNPEAEIQIIDYLYKREIKESGPRP